MRTHLAVTALIAVALLWAGMLVGVVLVAVPAQFATPDLPRELGLDVTRHVFASFGRAELALAAITLGLALAARPRALVWSLLAVIGLGVAAESLWLRPLLDQRVEQILAGTTPPPAPWHRLYGVIEVLKLGALVAAAWLLSRARAGAGGGR